MNTRNEIRQMRICEWKKVFEDKAASGLSAKEYCQQNGIGKDQFFYWQKIVRESVLNEIKLNRLNIPRSVEPGVRRMRATIPF